MREMKDSGIEWVGAIPATWKIHPLYYYFCERKCKNTLGKENNLLSLSYGRVIRKDINTVDGLLPENYNGYNIIEKDDIVLRLTDLQNDKRSLRTGLVREHGIITSAYTTIKANRELVPEFFQYLLHSYDVMKVLYNMGSGVRQGLNFSELSKMPLISPDMLEQKKIADFLDTKCSEIDAISADIQKEIEILEQFKRSIITEAVTKGLNPDAETKKSAIFYMAPYNSEWRLSKIGYECTKLARPFSPADMPLLCTNKGKVSPRPSDMTGKMVSEDNAMQGIHKGDIAIHGMDTWHGAIAMSEYDGKITRVVHVCDSKQDKRFIVYYLQQLAFNDVYKLISFGIRGNTSDFRSWDKVKDIYIALPDTDEQQKISDFLDLECRRVEDIVSEKKKQLDVLDAYKKSLIYEYVTGKKEAPLYES